MTLQVKVLLCLFVVNTVIALLYLLWNFKHEKNNYVIKSFVMILCPVVGICVVFCSFLFYKLFFFEPVDLDDVIFSKDRVKAVTHADEERERNIVPLEEAIEITDEKNLRTLMMNVVQGDIQKFLASISLALNSEDTETAHYAASVLQDALNDFRITVEKRRKLLMEDRKKRAILAESLMEYMNEVLKQRVFTDMEQNNYVAVMDEIGEFFYEDRPDEMTSSQFEEISMRLLEVGDYRNCQKWCERARYYHPDTLSTYTCQMKLYFTNGEKERFFEVLDELRHSTVVVDSETLEMIRVFSAGR